MDTIPLLKRLSETPGVSGHEGPVRDCIREFWTPLVDELREDGLNSLIGLKRGSGAEPRPKLMLAAHMDEIGLRVTGIEEEFLRVTSIGGTDLRLLPGLEVMVHGRQDIPGVVGMRPPHVVPQAERDRIVPWEQLFVDVGLPESRVKKLVQVGDPISFHREMVELRGGLVAGKAIDNRSCVAAITLILERLTRAAHAWDVVAVATSQEETGLYGAMTSTYGVAPDLALVLDVTFADQAGFSSNTTFALNEGPTIGIGPNFHPAVVERLRSTADDHEIPYRIEPISGRSGTDAWAVQVSREGVPTGLVEIPMRYMHQPVETVAVRTIERTGRLVSAFAAGLEIDYRPSWEDEA